MIVKITYDDKRMDVFDTSTFTAALPLGKANMLTNFEVRFDGMEDGELWLAAHGYKTEGNDIDEYDAEAVPVAKRSKGWRFLLSSAEELKHVELIVVDGEAVVKRVCGKLIDLQSFDEAAYECIGSSSKGLHDRIYELHLYLQRMAKTAEPSVPGVPESVLARIIKMKSSDQDEDEVEEDWGDLDEASW